MYCSKTYVSNEKKNKQVNFELKTRASFLIPSSFYINDVLPTDDWTAVIVFASTFRECN